MHSYEVICEIDNFSPLGSSGNFIFSLFPKLRIYRVRVGGNEAFQYLDMKSYASPHGFGMGGSTDNFRIFIPESMEECVARSFGPTYEPGPLLAAGESFEIESLEIWGCGGEEIVSASLNAQALHRDREDEAIRKARQCDKASFVSNSFDQEFFFSKTFAHKRNMSQAEEKDHDEPLTSGVMDETI